MGRLFNLFSAGASRNPQPKYYVDLPPRIPTDDEVVGWFKSAETRMRVAMPVRAELRSRNRVRWDRMQGDFAWMQKELKKMGLNPEDARWYL
jgi:hypothetical protein